jgi:hypothetical protein
MKTRLLFNIILIVSLITLSCSTLKHNKLDNNLLWRDKITYELYLKKNFYKKDYKDYEIAYKILLQEKLLGVGYDFDKDSVIDVYAFYNLNKINITKEKIYSNDKAKSIIINYDEKTYLIYISTNKKNLNYRYFELKDSSTKI